MKQIAEALVKAQKERNMEAESDGIYAFLKAIGHKTPGKNKHTALPMPARFLSKLAFGSGDCWIWVGSRQTHGYGSFPYQGENKAHRVSYRLFKGDIPPGMKVLHKCDVRACVNPDHLFIGTQKENVHDMMNKGRNRVKPLPGELNPMAKLTYESVQKIRDLATSGIKQIDLARQFGVSPMAISRVVNKGSWNV